MADSLRLIVGERPVIPADGYAGWLAMQRGIELLVAGSRESALVEHAPNATAALLDLNTLTCDGAALIRSLKSAAPRLRVMVLSSSKEPAQVGAVIRSGAEGYSRRFDSREALTEALRAVSAGGTHYGQEVADAFVDPEALHFNVVDPTSWNLEGRMLPADSLSTNDGLAGGHSLTPREREILLLVATGHNSASIGARLGIAVPTVRKHRENLIRKLDLHSIAEVTAFALRNGLLAS